MYANDNHVLRTPVKQQTFVMSSAPARKAMRKQLVQKRAELRPLAVLVDRRELLRVKLKSLMAEARIIRQEEHRTWVPLYQELRNHRVRHLRVEARATHLAYGLIRGLTREQMEPKQRKLSAEEAESASAKFSREQADKHLMQMVAAMVKKYGKCEVAREAVVDGKPVKATMTSEGIAVTAAS